MLLVRLFWLGCQTLFGLLPVFIISTSLHYTFYSSTLLISYVAMSMLGLNGIANLRWARRPPSARRLKAYFLLLFICTALFLIVYVLAFKSDYLTALVLVSGVVGNFKTLGLSYLRNSTGNSVSLFMIKDSLVFLAGSLCLFIVDSELSLIILLSVTFSGGIIFLLPYLLKAFSLSRLKLQIRTINYLYLILKSSAFLFFSSFFITYIPIISRSAVQYSQSEDYFIAFSVALSIAINIQKVSLSYFWVLQKKYWSKVSRGIYLDENTTRLGSLIIGTCILIFLAQCLFDYLNTNLQFPLSLLAMSIMISFHRMSVSFYRLHLLTVMSVFDVLLNQVKLFSLTLLLVGGLHLLLGSSRLFLLYMACILLMDILFVYHFPLKRRI